MRAINHAITGAAIGLVINQPEVALPVALASHFVCDAIPHADPDQHDKSWMKNRSFLIVLLIDASLCLALVVVLRLSQPSSWLLPVACAFLAAAPDLLWLKKYLRLRSNRPWQSNWFAKLAGRIQWFTRPIGVVVEAAWLMAGVVILWPFVR